jgi:copper oxidase (laccase) domain-containing protein
MTSNGKGYFDLWSANYDQLVHVGIPKENIEVAGICTYHNVGLFFSERHQKGRTGRFAAGMMLLT